MIVCFDTSVFGYAIDATAGPRHLSAVGILRRAIGSRKAVLLLQTLGELYAVATRKLATSPDDARSFVNDLRTVMPVYGASEADLDKAMDVAQRHGLSFWDALLWATADRVGVKYLLTEDFQDGRVLGGVTFVDPFDGGNQALLTKLIPRT